MYAAVVKLDTLADPVRAATQHHDLVTVGRRSFALFIVGGVHVGGVGRKLGGTGIHPLVDRQNVVLVAQLAHLAFRHAQQLTQTRIGKTLALEDTQEFRCQRQHAAFHHLLFELDDLFDLHQEPGVNLGQLEDTFHGETGPECVTDVPNPLRTGVLQFVTNTGEAFRILGIDHRIEASLASLQTTQRLVQRLLEVTTDGHHFTDRLHLSGQTVIGTGKLFEVETWHLGDHIVDRRLERRRGLAAGDVVHQLIQGVPDGQLGRDLGDRETGGLGGQCRGAGYPRIHLDDDHTAILRVDTKLDVGAAGFHADFTQYRHGGVTHQLVFLVGQCLSRSNRDGVAGVHTHGVEVFDGADDDAVIVTIPHHFHLVLFPADQGFIDQQFLGRREIQTTFADFDELFRVVGDTTARTTHGEGGADDTGESNLLLNFPGFVHVMGDTGTRTLQTDAAHGNIETTAVFGLVDGIGGSTDHLYAELGQHAVFFQLQGAVQRSLTTHGRQYRIRALFLDDFANHFPGNWLDIGRIGHLRVGHDGGRVGVHQDDAIALFTQGFTGLGARVVKFASLTDDNRACAQDQDAFKVCTFWHDSTLLLMRGTS